MRRFASLIMILLLILTFAAPATARTITNESWHQYDIWAIIESESVNLNTYAFDSATMGSGFGIHFEASYDCPDGHFAGFAWVNIYGGGDYLDEFTVDPTKGKDKYTTGYARGPFVWGNLSYRYCDNTGEDNVDLSGEIFTLDLDGTGGNLGKWTNSTSNHVPGEQNSHETWKGQTRDAFGMVDIGYPGPWEVWSHGGIGYTTYTHHSNGN